MVQTTAPGGFRRTLGRIFMWMGVATVLVFAAAIAGGVYFFTKKEKVPTSTVLELRLDRSLDLKPGSQSVLSMLRPRKPTLADALRAMSEGSKDANVKGMIVYVGGALGVATIQELRDGIANFRKAGKFAFAFTPSFGEMIGGTGPYYLATACDEIWM